MDLDELMRERHIGEYLAQETPEEQAIQSQLKGLVLWEYVFRGVLSRRDTVERTHGIRFEIRPKENGHNVPHCHASYQGQEISISLVDGEVITGNIPKQQQRFAVMWVKNNLQVLQAYWNKYHALEV